MFRLLASSLSLLLLLLLERANSRILFSLSLRSACPPTNQKREQCTVHLDCTGNRIRSWAATKEQLDLIPLKNNTKPFKLKVIVGPMECIDIVTIFAMMEDFDDL